MSINPNRVTEMFMDCLFNDDEIVNGKPSAEPIKVEGITGAFGLHPKRLSTHKEEVKQMLAQFPEEFMSNGGAGQTFLNLCMTSDGDQWTGMHQVMEQLVSLGIGLGFVKYTLNRKLWGALPGGMPYVTINLQDKAVEA